MKTNCNPGSSADLSQSSTIKRHVGGGWMKTTTQKIRRSLLLPIMLTLILGIPSAVAGDSWTRKADMITARSGQASCALDGKIYTFGGTPNGSGTSSISAVEVYDPTTNT
ncbi:MAG: kelch repeat-containing protein [Verrucomicrobia bacterium]|nr:kelch repeat-containing protein [Verrucomicrobiota bacterium]